MVQYIEAMRVGDRSGIVLHSGAQSKLAINDSATGNSGGGGGGGEEEGGMCTKILLSLAHEKNVHLRYFCLPVHTWKTGLHT